MDTILNKSPKWIGKVDEQKINVRVDSDKSSAQCTFSPLKEDTRIKVCDTVTDKDGNTWYYIKYKLKYGFALAKYITRVLSPLEKVNKYAPKVYDAIIEYRCIHASGANSFAEIKEKKRTTCASSASAVLQKADILPEGKLVSHTAAVSSNILSKKNTKAKAIYGLNNLDMSKCSIVKIGKIYSNMSDKYKIPGIVYIQDSNICINAGDDFVYSTNNSSSELNDNKKYIKDKVSTGYCFSSPILYAIIPSNKR